MTTPTTAEPEKLRLAGEKAALVLDMICGNCGKKVFVELNLTPYIDETKVGVNFQVNADDYAQHVATDHAQLLADASVVGGGGGLPPDTGGV